MSKRRVSPRPTTFAIVADDAQTRPQEMGQTIEVTIMETNNTLGHVPNFIQAINDLITTSSATARVNLANAANTDGLGLVSIKQGFEAGLNKLMSDKDIVLNGLRHSDTPLFGAFKKAFQRHNTQVLWSTFRPMFETDGQTSAFLGHIRYNKGEFTFDSQLKDVKVSAFSMFNCMSDSMVNMSAKAKSGTVTVELETVKVPVDLLLGEYDNWKNSLDHATPLKPDALTPPTLTLPADVDGIHKQVSTLQAQHEQDVYQVQASIAAETAIRSELEQIIADRDRLAMLVDDLQRELNFIKSNVPARKRRA